MNKRMLAAILSGVLLLCLAIAAAQVCTPNGETNTVSSYPGIYPPTSVFSVVPTGAEARYVVNKLIYEYNTTPVITGTDCLLGAFVAGNPGPTSLVGSPPSYMDAIGPDAWVVDSLRADQQQQNKVPFCCLATWSQEIKISKSSGGTQYHLITNTNSSDIHIDTVTNTRNGVSDYLYY